MITLFARKAANGFYIVDIYCRTVDRDGNLTDLPVPCNEGEYPDIDELVVE